MAATRWEYLNIGDRVQLAYVTQSAPLPAAPALAGGRAATRLRRLLSYMRPKTDGESVAFLLQAEGEPERFEIPISALGVLADVLDDLAEGRTCAVAPYELSIGSEEAARQLGVSRTWVNKMADRDDLPSRRIGQKRRFALGDIAAYRRVSARQRLVAADEWGFLEEDN
jgi:excisionase family DNA binding protein